MDKRQLANRIWESANRLRSKIEANEYKDYILGFIFYKFLSDKEEQYARTELGCGDEEIKNEFYETNAEVVNDLHTHLGYFIAHKDLFSTWLAKGAEFDVSNVRDALSAFARLVAPSHKKVFDKVFATLETGLSKLGDSAATQTKSIKSLLNLIRDIPMDGRQDYDVLGFVYEYLIGMFAANAGKKAGEFYTPHEVALFMAEVVANHLRNRQQITIYDPTSGSGSLLINIGRAVARHLNDPNAIKYYAQELIEPTYNLTRMNLLMRGILPANIQVRNGDTLERDWPWFDEANPDATYEPLLVDAVVSNPPYSQRWSPKDREGDPRYAGFGLAPKSKADLAFLLHDLYHLRQDGIMTIVMPHGVLFRGKENDGSEWSIRSALVEGNHIDAIVGLPPNIFFGTGIPTIVVVLRKNREREDVLIVDASSGFVKDGKKNRLRSSDVKRLSDVVTGHIELPGFSRCVSRDEIRANGYNLNIPRYVSNRQTEHWDIHAVMFGGVPLRELDDFASFWNVFPGLRERLFTVEGNYAKVKVTDLAEAIATAPSVQAYAASVNQALDGFDDFLKSELVEACHTVQVNAEEKRLADELFRRIAPLPLIDKYEAYQLLDDEWTQTATDLEIIQTEGFGVVRVVDPKMVLKKGKDEEETVEVQDGLVGRIIPFDLVQRTFFEEELSELEDSMQDVERISSDISALVGDISEDDRDAVIEEGKEELDAKLVAAKAAEIIADVETPETQALDAYLALRSQAEKKRFPTDHPEVDWTAMQLGKTGTYNKTEIVRRQKAIREAFSFEEGSFEAIVVKTNRLFNETKELKDEIKALGKALEEKTIGKINSLTDDEAKALLEAKWVKPVLEKLNGLPKAVITSLETSLKSLAEKYATTLSDVTGRVNTAEGELAVLLGELEGNPDDLAGLAAWKEELTR